MLITASVRRSAEFYHDQFGFEIDFIYEGCITNQPNYSVVKRDNLEIHFESYEHDQVEIFNPKVKCGVYFMVDNVDSLYEEFSGRGVSAQWPPTNQSYGIRDFKVLDCDGYQLLFGSLIPATKTEQGAAANP